MSFRRLHPEQPDSFAFTPENLAWAKEVIARYPEGRQASAVIPLLMRAQEQNGGWVSEPMIRYIAEMLDMRPIRVLEVATFYTQFQLQPVGRKAHIWVCGTTPCRLRGAEELIKVCKKRIAEKAHQISDDGDFSWEEVECLGACSNAPMIQIGEVVYEDLTAERFEEILDAIAAAEGPEEWPQPGPQNGRKSSEPLGDLTSLTDESLFEKGSDAEALIAAALKGGKGAVKVKGGTKAKGTAGTKSTREASATRKPTEKASEASANKKESAGKKAAAIPAVTEGAADSRQAGQAGAGKGDETAAPLHGLLDAEALKTVSTPAAETVEKAAPKEPKLFDKPPAQIDDLKLISGVGPKLEKLLHSLGIYTFAQVASWGAAEIKWVDDRLKFKGRIVRDKWVEQAAALALGGEEEYIRRFGKKPR